VWQFWALKGIYVRLSSFTSGSIIAIVWAFALSSCAYLIHGKKETIQVTSDPPGAAVTVSDGQTGVTPFSVTVRREQSLIFHFSKEGYQSVDVSDGSEIEARYYAPLLLGILFPPLTVGAAVDSFTGADHAHNADEVSARLYPIAIAGAAPSPSSTPTASNANWLAPSASPN
jgi:hypothetical protein